jgi:hypothetical protein
METAESHPHLQLLDIGQIPNMETDVPTQHPCTKQLKLRRSPSGGSKVASPLAHCQRAQGEVQLFLSALTLLFYVFLGRQCFPLQLGPPTQAVCSGVGALRR